ncbi:unnamed protein product [Amoebophrya sp. A120]|nr:unnamed protein product [Amoebophrya sp. A120]|eukprot:GSA120T00007240001.1
MESMGVIRKREELPEFLQTATLLPPEDVDIEAEALLADDEAELLDEMKKTALAENGLLLVEAVPEEAKFMNADGGLLALQTPSDSGAADSVEEEDENGEETSDVAAADAELPSQLASEVGGPPLLSSSRPTNKPKRKVKKTKRKLGTSAGGVSDLVTELEVEPVRVETEDIEVGEVVDEFETVQQVDEEDVGAGTEAGIGEGVFTGAGNYEARPPAAQQTELDEAAAEDGEHEEDDGNLEYEAEATTSLAAEMEHEDAELHLQHEGLHDDAHHKKRRTGKKGKGKHKHGKQKRHGHMHTEHDRESHHTDEHDHDEDLHHLKHHGHHQAHHHKKGHKKGKGDKLHEDHEDHLDSAAAATGTIPSAARRSLAGAATSISKKGKTKGAATIFALGKAAAYAAKKGKGKSGFAGRKNGAFVGSEGEIIRRTSLAVDRGVDVDLSEDEGSLDLGADIEEAEEASRGLLPAKRRMQQSVLARKSLTEDPSFRPKFPPVPRDVVLRTTHLGTISIPEVEDTLLLHQQPSSGTTTSDIMIGAAGATTFDNHFGAARVHLESANLYSQQLLETMFKMADRENFEVESPVERSASPSQQTEVSGRPQQAASSSFHLLPSGQRKSDPTLGTDNDAHRQHGEQANHAKDSTPASGEHDNEQESGNYKTQMTSTSPLPPAPPLFSHLEQNITEFILDHTNAGTAHGRHEQKNENEKQQKRFRYVMEEIRGRERRQDQHVAERFQLNHVPGKSEQPEQEQPDSLHKVEQAQKVKHVTPHDGDETGTPRAARLVVLPADYTSGHHHAPALALPALPPAARPLAYKAGMREGDVVLAICKEKITSVPTWTTEKKTANDALLQKLIRRADRLEVPCFTMSFMPKKFADCYLQLHAGLEDVELDLRLEQGRIKYLKRQGWAVDRQLLFDDEVIMIGNQLVSEVAADDDEGTKSKKTAPDDLAGETQEEKLFKLRQRVDRIVNVSYEDETDARKILNKRDLQRPIELLFRKRKAVFDDKVREEFEGKRLRRELVFLEKNKIAADHVENDQKSVENKIPYQLANLAVDKNLKHRWQYGVLEWEKEFLDFSSLRSAAGNKHDKTGKSAKGRSASSSHGAPTSTTAGASTTSKHHTSAKGKQGTHVHQLHAKGPSTAHSPPSTRKSRPSLFSFYGETKEDHDHRDLHGEHHLRGKHVHGQEHVGKGDSQHNDAQNAGHTHTLHQQQAPARKSLANRSSTGANMVSMMNKHRGLTVQPVVDGNKSHLPAGQHDRHDELAVAELYQHGSSAVWKEENTNDASHHLDEDEEILFQLLGFKLDWTQFPRVVVAEVARPS